MPNQEEEYKLPQGSDDDQYEDVEPDPVDGANLAKVNSTDGEEGYSPDLDQDSVKREEAALKLVSDEANSED